MGYVTPEYSWKETADEVYVRAYIQGVPRQSFDVFVTSCFLKVNAPPYFFSCDLEGEIDESTCVVLLDSSGVEFQCKKFQPGKLWGQLVRNLTSETKHDIARRRFVSAQATYGRAKLQRSSEVEARANTDNLQLKKQWELDQKQQSVIYERMEAELTAERDGVRSWRGHESYRVSKAHFCAEIDENIDDDVENGYKTEVMLKRNNSKDDRTPDVCVDRIQLASCNTQSKPATAELCPDATISAGNKNAHTKSQNHTPSQSFEINDRTSEVNEVRWLSPRSPIRVCLDFTKLENDHMPARESRELKFHQLKQKDDIGKTVDDDHVKSLTAVDVSEHEPIFVKDKGDTFFRAGNYLSAISAYTQAVNVEKRTKGPSETLTRLYANRAACFLNDNQPQEAIDDCTAALYLLESIDISSSSREQVVIDARRQKLLVRRAKGHVEINKLHHARADLSAALNVGEYRTDVARDLEEVRLCSILLDSSSLRCLGDARYRAKNFTGAIHAYSLALALAEDIEHLVKAEILVNRAACRISLSDYEGACGDCGTALNLILCGGVDTLKKHERLRSVPSCRAGLIHDDTTYGEVNIADRCNSMLDALLIKVLHCRGAAAFHMQRYHHAISDYKIAAGLMIEETAAKMNSDISAIKRVAVKCAEEKFHVRPHTLKG